MVNVYTGEVYPGGVAIHVHAPQWPQAALALDEPLYLWLEQRTFPLESRFADLDFARTVYRDLVQQLLARGSTTTVYLGSAHLESSIELAAICADEGQRALVGKTVMDDPVANPAYYRDASPTQAVADTETLIKEVEAIGRDSDLTGFGVFDEPADRLARILYLSTPDNIRQVYVQGRLVRDKDND
ncbi:MAG: amidohydrolase family protein [Coriobacteriales bacterium]